MTNGTKAVKINAKNIFKAYSSPCFFAGLIFLFSYFIFYMLCSILAYIDMPAVAGVLLYAVIIFVVSPIFLGLLRFYWCLLFNKFDNPVSIFFYLYKKELYFKALKLVLSLVLKLILRIAFYMLPAIVVLVLASQPLYTAFDISMPLWVGYLSHIENGLIVLGLIAAFFSMLRFYLTPMLFVINDEIDVDEAINMSRIISKKTSTDFIYLVISLFIWIIASIFVLPLIFTIPYFCLCYLVHSKNAIDEYNNHIEAINDINRNNYFEGI